MKKEIGNWTAYLWDCLEVMDELIQEWIKVDAIITDPPYWTTACKRDAVIPFPDMWERLNKIKKTNWAIALFWSEPFSSALRMSNIKNYKYDWKWQKDKWTNFALANKQPLKNYEDIIVFYNKQPYFNSEWDKLEKPITRVQSLWNKKTASVSISNWNKDNRTYITYTHKKKNAILYYARESQFWQSSHPTQKPVALMEYLIKTYTQEWELVLDFTAWSFTTAVACENTNRKWIWIEKDETYFNIWVERINNLNLK